MTDGRIGFRSEDREGVLEAGGHIIKPRREVHAMWNAGPTRARMIEVISPAGFEEFFRELAALSAANAVTPEELGRLSGAYALPFATPGVRP